MLDLSFLKPMFIIKRIEYAGVDGAIVRAELVASSEGEIEKKKLGLKVIVKG